MTTASSLTVYTRYVESRADHTVQGTMYVLGFLCPHIELVEKSCKLRYAVKLSPLMVMICPKHCTAVETSFYLG